MSFSLTLLLGLLAAEITFGSSLCVAVKDPVNLPLPGATVTATALLEEKQEVERTDNKGAACFKDLPEGWFTVETSMAGFLTVRYYPVRLVPENLTNLKFELPLGEITEARVTKEALVAGTLKLRDKPVPAAQICFKRTLANSSARCVHTTGDGEYVLYVLPGDYQIDITAGAKVFSSTLHVLAGATYRNPLTFK